RASQPVIHARKTVMHGWIIRSEFRGPLELTRRVRIVPQALERVPQFEMRSAITIIDRESLLEQFASSRRINPLRIHRLRLKEIAGSFRRMGRGVGSKNLRYFG